MGYKAKRSDGQIDLRTVPKAERQPPTSGQSGPKRLLAYAQLNTLERKVLKDYCASPTPRHVADVAEATRLTKLQVRNTIRRLVRGSYLVRVDGDTKWQGIYRMTKSGFQRFTQKN